MFQATVRAIALCAVFGVLLAARAEDLTGYYHGVAVDEASDARKPDRDVNVLDTHPLVIERTGEDQYTATCPEWTSLLFWNKESKKYEGVFRYNNSTAEGSKGAAHGKSENAVGYHSIVPKGDGVYEVTYQWGLSPESGGRGSFKIKRAE